MRRMSHLPKSHVITVITGLQFAFYGEKGCINVMGELYFNYWKVVATFSQRVSG